MAVMSYKVGNQKVTENVSFIVNGVDLCPEGFTMKCEFDYWKDLAHKEDILNDVYKTASKSKKEKFDYVNTLFEEEYYNTYEELIEAQCKALNYEFCF